MGAHLFESGHRVTLVARGENLRALQSHGLTLETPGGVRRLAIPAVDEPINVEPTSDTTVLLCVKSQHTARALGMVAAAVSVETPVVCVQNGVANERRALRMFRNVNGVSVMCPATFLVPGVFQAHSTPVTGILDIGRYPSGSDETSDRVARAFRRSSFMSEVRDDIVRWKYRKLLTNLSNAVEALCGRAARGGRVAQLATTEGERVLAAAGIEFASADEDRLRRGDHVRVSPIGGEARGGGSAWQSLAREAGSVETDFLNGEIVLLGRLHGVPTPVNELLQGLTRRYAYAHKPPGTMSETDLMALLPPSSTA